MKEFEREHQRRYGYVHPNREVELVTLRFRASMKSATAQLGTGAFARPGRAKLGSPSTPKATVVFDGKNFTTAIYSRDALKPGKTYSGPAIITEYSATTVIPRNQRFHLDHAGNLIVTIR